MIDSLTSHLHSIWQDIVHFEFRQGAICSERHLQAIFYKAFQLDGISAWVEPKLSGKNINRIEGYAPDLLFTSSDEIIGVVEIRYSPYYQLEPQNDMYRFETFRKEMKDEETYEIYLKTNPENGDINTHEIYHLSPQMIFIYAVIAKEGSKALDKSFFSEYNANSFAHFGISV